MSGFHSVTELIEGVEPEPPLPAAILRLRLQLKSSLSTVSFPAPCFPCPCPFTPCQPPCPPGTGHHTGQVQGCHSCHHHPGLLISWTPEFPILIPWTPEMALPFPPALLSLLWQEASQTWMVCGQVGWIRITQHLQNKGKGFKELMQCSVCRSYLYKSVATNH